ncbi:hypothetical protein JK358_04290 [Nocardia sp. 2]|uniref:Uncharacterized protein n=1 Tax=Nocardia acididurans TaxID=2802282 RepID=A0ABS1LZB4_9NOCA|nr:hypothetical protein [Nocardia acididurans]
MVLFPIALMLFALVMERVENRLRKLLEPDPEVQQYLDRATNAEVSDLTKLGVPAAAARARRRSPAKGLDVAQAS